MFEWDGTWENGQNFDKDDIEYVLSKMCRVCGRRNGEHIAISRGEGKFACPDIRDDE